MVRSSHPRRERAAHRVLRPLTGCVPRVSSSQEESGRLEEGPGARVRAPTPPQMHLARGARHMLRALR